MKTLLPKGWKQPKGYSNAVVAEGETIFVGGQIGWDENEKMVSSELTVQVEQALKNIVTVLKCADAKPEHIVRMTWFVTDIPEYRRSLKQVGEAYRKVMGYHYPAMSLLGVAGLMEPGAKVEIEATAVLPKGKGK